MSGAPDHAGGSGLASALTDLMTSLAVIFVLLLVASLNNAQQEARDLRNDVRTRLVRALDLSALPGFERIEVREDERDPLGLIVVVPEQLFRFPFGSARVPAEGLAFLREFTPVLGETVCRKRFRAAIASVVVEGHTDMVGSDEANLELSQRRSMAVVVEILGALARGGQSGGVHDCFLDLLSASGRGRREPLVDVAAGQVDAERSRRVVFKVRVKSLEQRVVGETLVGTAGVR